MHLKWYYIIYFKKNIYSMETIANNMDKFAMDENDALKNIYEYSLG